MDPPYGAIVTIPQGRGVVRFKGPTSFMTTGKWVGIELYEKNGKNDGSVDGISYFNCELGYGVFVRPSQIRSIHGSELDARPSVSYRGAFLFLISLMKFFGYYPRSPLHPQPLVALQVTTGYQVQVDCYALAQSKALHLLTLQMHLQDHPVLKSHLVIPQLLFYLVQLLNWRHLHHPPPKSHLYIRYNPGSLYLFVNLLHKNPHLQYLVTGQYHQRKHHPVP